MLWHVYLRNDTAYVPTVSQTESFFLDTDPVEVVSAVDSEALRHAVKQAIGRGNPRVPAPTRVAFPASVVLKYAKMKSWSAFEKGCSLWTIEEKDGLYKIQRGRKRPDRGWEADPAQVEVLPPGIGIDEIAQRVASSVQSALGVLETGSKLNS
jgi:hypothetical protein